MLLLDEEASVLALRVQGVGGDHGASQVERGQRRAKPVISLVLSGTRSWVTVRPVPVTADSKWAAGASPVREPRALLPSRARLPAPAGAYPSRSARPPGHTASSTRRMVVR